MTDEARPHECPVTRLGAVLIAVAWFGVGLLCGSWWFC